MREHLLRVEARGDREEPLQAAHEQPGADEEHDAPAPIWTTTSPRRVELIPVCVTRADPCQAWPLRSRVALQRRQRYRPATPTSIVRPSAKASAGPSMPIAPARGRSAGLIATTASTDANASADAEQAAEDREQKRFDEQLSNRAARATAPSAARTANLAATLEGRRQQQIRDVDAGNGQQHGDRAEDGH